MALKRILPTSYYSKEDAEAARYQLEDNLTRANKGLSALRELSNELGTLPQLADITPQWVNEQVDGKLLEVAKLPIPTTSKEALRHKWNDIKNKALQSVEAVRLIDGFKADGLQVFLASDGTIKVDGVDDYTKHLATINTTQEQQEHWRLIGNLIESLNKLRVFEDKNALKHLTPQTLSTLQDGEDYLQRFSYGFFSKRPSTPQIKRAQFSTESHGTHRLIIGGHDK